MHLSIWGANPVVVGIYFRSSLDKAQHIQVLASIIVCSVLYRWYYCKVGVQEEDVIYSVNSLKIFCTDFSKRISRPSTVGPMPGYVIALHSIS